MKMLFLHLQYFRLNYLLVFTSVFFHITGANAQQIHPMDSGQLIKIPVIFHNVYQSDAEKISEEQIRLQLLQLNLDFSLQNDVSDVHSDFTSIIGNARLEFHLSQTHPSIIYQQTSTPAFGDQSIYADSSGGSTPVAPATNLNIWIANLTPGISGWSKNKLEDSITQGVVVDYEYLVNGSIANRNLGRTVTHEIGHWLGLTHPWGTGGCSSDDGISDTPTQEQASFECNTSVSSCGSLDASQNFMDYLDDHCRLFFTIKQVDSLRNFLLSHHQELISGGLNLGVSNNTLQPEPNISLKQSNRQLCIHSKKGFDEFCMYNSNGMVILRKNWQGTENTIINLNEFDSVMLYLVLWDEGNIIYSKKIFNQ